eukprot:6260001-Pyramimonas_sp.AAC.1
MVFVAANCTPWASMKQFLPLTTAHVVLCQEHELTGAEEIRRAQAWCIRNGWKSHLEPGTMGPNGGPSAGVAVLACSFLGFTPPILVPA